MSKFLNVTELCDVLRAPKSTIYQYSREGMPKFQVGKESRFILDKVVTWLERRAIKTNQPTPKKRVRSLKVRVAA